ncbi:MAG: hypothetical protein ACRC2R_20085 [Xenococcaceae cyanobacterium]
MSNEQVNTNESAIELSDESAIELSDEQLDGIAGGARGYSSRGGRRNVNVNQNSNAVAVRGNANSRNNAVIN